MGKIGLHQHPARFEAWLSNLHFPWHRKSTEHESKLTLHQCAAHLSAAFQVYMLHQLPFRTFAALRGVCHALQDITDAASCDIPITAVKAAKLLPPATAAHLSSSQSWQAVLCRHAAVVRRLRSGFCTSTKHLRINADHCVKALNWSLAAQPLLAIYSGPRQSGHYCKQLHLIETSTGQHLLHPPCLPALCQILLQDWVSDRHLLWEVSEDSDWALIIFDASANVQPRSLHVVRSWSSPDRQQFLARLSSHQLAVYQLPALQLKYAIVPSAVTMPPSLAATATAADTSMTSHDAQWSATNSHLAVCWRVRVGVDPQPGRPNIFIS